MSYLGDFAVGSTVVVRFNTEDLTGAPITLAGTPAVSVYKNSLTESTAGVSLSVDYDGRTGLHSVAIDTSADGTFYAAGSTFDVVITTGTVNGISAVGNKVGAFSLAARTIGSIAAGAITAAAIASDAITASKVADGFLTAAKFASGAFDAVWSVAARLLTAGTNIVLAKGVGVTGFNDLSAAQVNAEADTAIADAALATASNLAVVAGYLDTEIAAIKDKTDNLPSDPADQSALEAAITAATSPLATASALATVQADTDNLQTRIPAALVGGRMDVSVGAMATGVIAAATFAANALDAVWSTATRVLTSGLNIVLAKGTGVTGFNDLSSQNVADATWNEVLTSHNTAFSAAHYIKNLIATPIGLLPTRITAFFSLALRKDAAVATDFASYVADLNANNGSGAGAYDNTTDSMEARQDDKAGYSLTSAYDPAKTAAQAGDAMTLTAAYDAAKAAASQTSVDGVAAAAAAAVTSDHGSGSYVRNTEPPNAATIAAAVRDVDNATPASGSLGERVAAVPTSAQNADKLLGRNIAGGSDGGRDVTSALRATRNRVVIDGTTITVYAEDDTTPAWTGTVTRVELDALQEINPA